MIFDLVRDFADVLDAMPKEHIKIGPLQLLNEAIRRTADFVEQHPTTFFQELWNIGGPISFPLADLLAQPDFDECLNEKTNRPFSTTSLTLLLRDWLSDRSKTHAGAYWLRALWLPEVPLGTGMLATLSSTSQSLVSISPDGRFLAAVAEYGFLTVWEMSTFREVIKDVSLFEGPASREQYEIANWDGTFEDPCAAWTKGPFSGHTSRSLTSLTWSADSTSLIGGTSFGEVFRWRASDGMCKSRHAPDHRVTGLASCSAIKTVLGFLFDDLAVVPSARSTDSEDVPYPSREIHTPGIFGAGSVVLEMVDGPVSSVDYAPNGSKVCVVAGGRLLLFEVCEFDEFRCDPADAPSQPRHIPSTERHYLAAFSPCSQFIASVSAQDRLQVWNVNDAAMIYSASIASQCVAIAWSADSSQIAIGTGEGELAIHCLASDSCYKNPKAHSAAITGIIHSLAQGGWITVSRDQSLAIWDLTTLPTAPQHRAFLKKAAEGCCAIPSSNVIAVAVSGEVQIWSMTAGAGRSPLRIEQIGSHALDHEAAVPHVVSTETELTIASGTKTWTVEMDPAADYSALWCGTEINWAAVLARPVRVIEESPDGRWIAASDDDGTLRIWDPTDSFCEVINRESRAAITAIKWRSTSDGLYCLRAPVVHCDGEDFVLDEGVIQRIDRLTGGVVESVSLREIVGPAEPLPEGEVIQWNSAARRWWADFDLSEGDHLLAVAIDQCDLILYSARGSSVTRVAVGDPDQKLLSAQLGIDQGAPIAFVRREDDSIFSVRFLPEVRVTRIDLDGRGQLLWDRHSRMVLAYGRPESVAIQFWDPDIPAGGPRFAPLDSIDRNDWQSQSLCPSEDGAQLLLRGEIGTQIESLVQMDVSTGKSRPLARGDLGDAGFSADSAWIMVEQNSTEWFWTYETLIIPTRSEEVESLRVPHRLQRKFWQPFDKYDLEMQNLTGAERNRREYNIRWVVDWRYQRGLFYPEYPYRHAQIRREGDLTPLARFPLDAVGMRIGFSFREDRLLSVTDTGELRAWILSQGALIGGDVIGRIVGNNISWIYELDAGTILFWSDIQDGKSVRYEQLERFNVTTQKVDLRIRFAVKERWNPYWSKMAVDWPEVGLSHISAIAGGRGFVLRSGTEELNCAYGSGHSHVYPATGTPILFAESMSGLAVFRVERITP